MHFKFYLNVFMEKIEEILLKHLNPAENYIYGFADVHGLLDKKFEGFDWGISIGHDHLN